jgi:hypothetical protein
MAVAGTVESPAARVSAATICFTVASLAMLAVVIAPRSVELLAARLTVAGLIAARVFLNIRSSNSAARAGLYGWPLSWPE